MFNLLPFNLPYSYYLKNQIFATFLHIFASIDKVFKKTTNFHNKLHKVFILIFIYFYVVVSDWRTLFQGDITNFSYPSSICEVWERRVLFYGHTVPNLVQADDSINDDIKAMWQEDENNDFYNWQMEYCELFKNNRLYVE